MCSQIKRLLPESKVDEIWREDRCSDKVNAHFLTILLEIISTEIISIQCNFDHFLVKNKFSTPT